MNTLVQQHPAPEAELCQKLRSTPLWLLPVTTYLLRIITILTSSNSMHYLFMLFCSLYKQSHTVCILWRLDFFFHSTYFPEDMSTLLWYVQCVLVSSGGCNKVLQTGWLKQQKYISHSSGAWKSKIKVWQTGFLVKALFLASDSCLLGSSPDLSSGCRMVTGEGGRRRKSECKHTLASLPLFFFYKSTNPTMRVPSSKPHLNLITSQRHHLQTLSHWSREGLGFQHINFVSP